MNDLIQNITTESKKSKIQTKSQSQINTNAQFTNEDNVIDIKQNRDNSL